jgi:hypothetical protein
VLANEASGASSFGGMSVEGGPVHSEGGTPGTPDIKLRDMNVPEVCNWLTGESFVCVCVCVCVCTCCFCWMKMPEVCNWLTCESCVCVFFVSVWGDACMYAC